MLRNFYSAFCFINIVIFASGDGEGIYTVIAPGTLHPYFNYNVAITVHQAEGPCEIEVAVYSSTYKISKTINILPMTTENVEFEMPKLERDDYRLSVKGVSGILFENSTDLNFENYQPLVYIQMDKSIYKPGDLVQFRVLFLNQKTHPEHLKTPMLIVIKNGNKNSVQHWYNINLTHGVYTGDFQLSEHSMKDWWYISVFDGENTLVEKRFAVIEYDLPNFEVFMDVPENVPISDEFITITVRSKFTFGKPVKGKATVSIRQIDGPSNYSNKTFFVDGRGHVEFNIWKDLPHSELISTEYFIEYEVMANLEDELSGKKQYAAPKYFYLHKNNIVMTALNGNAKYQPGKLITFTVIGKRFDGSPVYDDMNAVELSINDLVFYSMFNQSGMATFNFVLQKMNGGSVYAKYLGTKRSLRFIYSEEMKVDGQQPERFQLILKTEKPQLKKELLIEVVWTEPIDYFVYILVARGNIIKNKRVEVPNDSQSYVIKLITTLDMIPEASIFIQYVYNDNLRFEEMTITFERDFENAFEITTTAEASPGDDIEFHLTTDPYSYVGLLGVDQSVLLYGNSHDGINHDLDGNDIFNDLLRYKTYTPHIPGSGRYPGKISGLVSMTNSHFPWSSNEILYGVPKSLAIYPVPRIRFPETWIFENFNITNQTHFSFTRQIPDTITSWVITGFSMNSNTGFALTKNPTKIQVFKPFFIIMNLPSSVKQGEVISVPVLVFNYMNQAINAEVTLDNSDNEFDFVEAANEIEERTVNKVKDFKRISIPNNSAGSVSFLIRPKIVGILTLKVVALTALAGDSVHMKLKVESDGVTQYQNRAFFINLSKNPEQTETLTLDIPANAVPNSEHIELSAIGNLVGLSIKHIEDLVRLPVGYGEQNMINFVPSILILKYLQTIDEKMPNVTKTARNILKIGFQRELSFRHSDGSFSAYGGSDISGRLYESDGKTVTGSTWLTAYVARSFQQASEFIDIDEEIVSKSFEFLAAKQTTSGNFAEFGRLLEFPHLNDMSLTAFVLLAFLENKEISTKYEMHINRGIGYLVRSFGDTDDTYSLSITALVLQKANHPLADQVKLKQNAMNQNGLTRWSIMAKLKQNAMNQNGLTWWSIDTGRQKRQTHAFKSSDIEITSYILLAMLEKGPTEDALPIIKWLTMQRNSNGGFTSTQDTVVGLQALIKFAERTGLTRTGAVNIDYKCEGNGVEDKGTITIIPENLMVLNTHELPKNTRKVTFTAKGNSSSLVQLSYKYNTIDKEPEQSFRLSVSTRENAPPKLLPIDICAKFVPTAVGSNENKTNMIVIEVNLPSGYTIGREELDGIRDFKTILFTETKKSDTVAILYLNSLEVDQEKCISIEANKIHDIAKQKPVPVVIYDYYDKERRATEYYHIKSSLCEICEGADCALGCEDNKKLYNSGGTTFDV